MNTIVYKIDSYSMRIPFSYFAKIEASRCNEFMDNVACYIEDNLNPLPDYICRGITMRSVHITAGCTDAIATYVLGISIKEKRFNAELNEIAEKCGVEIERTKFTYLFDSPSYEIVLKGEGEPIFTAESLGKEQAFQREVNQRFRATGLIFSIHS